MMMMKFVQQAVALLAVLAVVVDGAEDSHDHGDDHDDDHGHSCACEAEELGFTIDCTNEMAMLSALTALKTNGCSTDCSSDTCVKNYYIVQSHHDYCPETQIPEEIEDGFHDFDTSCEACDIERTFIEGADDCPIVDCSTSEGDEAYSRLLDNGCLSDCSSDTCGNDYLILVR